MRIQWLSNARVWAKRPYDAIAVLLAYTNSIFRSWDGSNRFSEQIQLPRMNNVIFGLAGFLEENMLKIMASPTPMLSS